jgi:hypothetical protein
MKDTAADANLDLLPSQALLQRFAGAYAQHQQAEHSVRWFGVNTRKRQEQIDAARAEIEHLAVYIARRDDPLFLLPLLLLERLTPYVILPEALLPCRLRLTALLADASPEQARMALNQYPDVFDTHLNLAARILRFNAVGGETSEYAWGMTPAWVVRDDIHAAITGRKQPFVLPPPYVGLLMSLLATVEQAGDEKRLPAVEALMHLTEEEANTPELQQMRERAAVCHLRLTNPEAKRLLRPAQSPDAADHLLRPVGKTPSDMETLLRPITPEPPHDSAE